MNEADVVNMLFAASIFVPFFTFVVVVSTNVRVRRLSKRLEVLRGDSDSAAE